LCHNLYVHKQEFKDFRSIGYIIYWINIILDLSFAGVLHNIFDGLTDKEEQVRVAMQQAIVKILETHPERTAEILSEHRTQQPKMTEQTVAMLLE